MLHILLKKIQTQSGKLKRELFVQENKGKSQKILKHIKDIV